MLQIYFDDYLLNNGWVRSLTQSVEMFDTQFKLGSTVCRTFTLEVDKKIDSYVQEVIENEQEEELETNSLEYILATLKESIASYKPSKIYLKDEDDNLYATLYIDELDDEYNAYFKYSLTDAMVKFNQEFVYDISTEKSVKTLLEAICSNHNISLVTQAFYMDDLMVSWNQEGMTERDFIGYVAEVNAGYAYIDMEGNLVITPYIKTPTDYINVEDCSSFKLGSYHYIDRVYVELASGTHYYPETSENETVYLNSDNILITDSGNYLIENIIWHIQQSIVGFNFYNIKVDRCPINSGVWCGDIIQFKLNDNTYNTITQIEYSYGGSWFGGYELSLENSEQQETQIDSSAQKAIKQLKIVVDRELNSTKTEILEQVEGEYATKSSLEQTASEISMNFVSREKNSSGDFADEDYKKLNKLETNITFDANGINISDPSSDSNTNLQLSKDGVTISGYGDSENDITAMQPNQFRTGLWIMQQGGNYFNIFKMH